MIRVLRVYGVPAPKGSTKAFVVAGKARTTDASPRTRPWMFAVADAARQVYGHETLPLGGAFGVDLTFFMPRPRSHFTKSGDLKRYSSTWPFGRTGDLDKLDRAVLDALTGIVWIDDCQVVQIHSQKLYENAHFRPGVEIRILQAEDLEEAPF